jgi:hypothetical protein
MNYRNQDSIKEIQNIIKSFKSKWKNHKEDKALEAEINWNAYNPL